MKLPICPVCGQKGALFTKWVRNGRSPNKYRYFYVKHYNPQTQNARWCYCPRSVTEALISLRPVLQAKNTKRIATAIVDYVNKDGKLARAHIPIYKTNIEAKAYLVYKVSKRLFSRPHFKAHLNQPLPDLKAA
ncbi:MAG: hypothetical protein QMD23_08560, partial [Candidatus Bathyarchaeia archaeon]|nr:hypothetical protein [Candidatus Bathyarchaeia archaeon]